jgi:hypothetical protein
MTRSCLLLLQIDVDLLAGVMLCFCQREIKRETEREIEHSTACERLLAHCVRTSYRLLAVCASLLLTA